MRSNTLLAGAAVAALAVVSTAAWAAETAAPSTPSNLRSNLTQMLRNSGYTDIRVAPSSFVVRATDDNGNPVVMSISPDQFTEVTAFGATPATPTAEASVTEAMPARIERSTKTTTMKATKTRKA